MQRRAIRLSLAIAAGVLVALAAKGAIETWSLARSEGPPEADTEVVLRPDPRGDVYELEVRRADDVGKPGNVRGVMGWKFFDHVTDEGASSPDQLHFVFDSPARIHAIQISADITDVRADLVEFVAGLNLRGYGEQRAGDPLVHVSWADHRAIADGIDRSVSLPEGVEVEAGDFIGVGAWLDGRADFRVSPEIVVLYEWLPE